MATEKQVMEQNAAQHMGNALFLSGTIAAHTAPVMSEGGTALFVLYEDRPYQLLLSQLPPEASGKVEWLKS